MSNVIPFQPGQVSRVFANDHVQDDLSAGVAAGFGLIGYRGKVWSIRYRGEERKLLRDDGDGPRNSIEVVILKASTVISKIWYEQGWVEGNNEAPDCYSLNGVSPEVQSRKRQSDACALCPRNVWGSRTTPQGKQGKECADSKRLAVVPLGDINNEVFGGPLLLRVPAASLQELAQYGQKMQKLGYPYYAIGTRIAFDAEQSYPKFVFSGIRPLTDDEAPLVKALRDGHMVDRIIGENEFQTVPVKPAAALAAAFEQPPTGGPAQLARNTPAPAQTQTNGFGAMTGSAQSQSAPDAAAPSTTTTSSGLGPVSPPAQTTQPASQNGTATPVVNLNNGASGVQSSGFGATAPMTGETITPEVTPSPSGTAFEAELDAKLGSLLPK